MAVFVAMAMAIAMALALNFKFKTRANKWPQNRVDLKKKIKQKQK